MKENADEEDKRNGDSYKNEISNLKAELQNVKTAAVISEQNVNDEVARVKQQYEDEIATLNLILKEAVADAYHTGDRERFDLKKENERLQIQLHDLKATFETQHHGQDGLLSTVFRSWKMPTSSPSTPSFGALEDDDPELTSPAASFRIAPALHPELKRLHDQLLQTEKNLKIANNKVKIYEQRLKDELEENEDSGNGGDAPSEHETETLKQSSKGDLRILVGVLTTQKQVLQEDLEHLKDRFNALQTLALKASRESSICRRLGKKVLGSTMQQSATDSTTSGALPTSPRHQCQQSETVSGAPQQSLLKRLDRLERCFSESAHLYSEEVTNEGIILQSGGLGTAHSYFMMEPTIPGIVERKRSRSFTDGTMSQSCSSTETGTERTRTMPKLSSGDSGVSSQDRINRLSPEPGASDSSIGSSSEVTVGTGGSSKKKSMSLEQLAAPSGKGFGAVMTKSVPITIEPSSKDGSGIVSLSRSPSEADPDISSLYSQPNDSGDIACEMCANYEFQLQQSQNNEKKSNQELQTVKSLCERYKEDLQKEQSFRADVEHRITALFDEITTKTSKITSSSDAHEKLLKDYKAKMNEDYRSFRAEITDLLEDRSQMSEQLDKMQKLYDQLLGTHRNLAEEMRNELIDLPPSIEELQELCLKLREELIEAKAAKEHIEQSLRNEILFLRSQVESEQHSKDQMEEMLSEEVNQLRTDLAVARSTASQLQEKLDTIGKKETELAAVQSTFSEKEAQAEKAIERAEALERDLSEARQKTLALQQELDTSNNVCADFVQLCQRLQVDLEKIRQAEHEVRWQFEDDVLICNGPCKAAFTRQKAKLHCRHCGKIFCQNCLSRTAPSGPQRRPARVCDLCHTILVQDSAPYFSTLPSTELDGTRKSDGVRK